MPPAWDHRPPEPFRCEVRRDGTSAWVRPIGELDMGTTDDPEAQLAALRASGVRWIGLDLSGLEFMDSTGLKLVLRWDAAARADGFAFRIVRAVGAVDRLFRVTGTDGLLSAAARSSRA